MDITQLFMKIDVSRTGSLNQQEMANFLSMIIPNISRQHIEVLFNKIDVDNDQKISFEEF